MSEAFPHVFEPLRLRHRTLRSRITFGAHTANMAEDGLPGERHIGYYRERALGGAGMIVVEPVPVHRTGVLTRGNFRHDDDAIIPAFRRVTDACRAANPDVVMVHQLYHVGQHGDADNSFAPNWSPSGLPSYHDADGSHAMTVAEIEELLDGFVAAAGRAQASGFDGIEVFAAYHAVVDQFWAPWSNRRDDDWGGTFEGRMRFSAELLRRIRERCGDDFIIGLAVSVDPGAEATPGIEELHRDRGLARRAPADGLRHVRHRLVLRLRGRSSRRRSTSSGWASRSPAALKGCRPPRGRPGREPHPDARRGRGRPRGRPCRHGQHRPRPDRRPASRRQGASRAPRRGPAVHLVQPAVLGAPVARLLDLVPDQSVGRAGVRVGRRPVRAAAHARARSSSSAAGRPDWRRRVSRRSAAIT